MIDLVGNSGRVAATVGGGRAAFTNYAADLERCRQQQQQRSYEEVTCYTYSSKFHEGHRRMRALVHRDRAVICAPRPRRYLIISVHRDRAVILSRSRSQITP